MHLSSTIPNAQPGARFLPPAVVVEPVGQVGALGDLVNQQARAQGVDRARGDVDHVALLDRHEVEQLEDRAVQRRGAQLRAGHRALNAVDHPGARLGLEHHPGLGLAQPAAFRLVGAGVGVVGVHLHAEPLGGVQELDQERQPVTVSLHHRPPQEGLAQLGQHLGERPPGVGARGNAVFIEDHPGLADGLVGGEPEPLGQAPPAPDARLELGLERD